MGVWDTIDGCVYISAAECHVERNCVDGVGIDARIRHDSGPVCATPCFTPGYLAGLTCLPVGECSLILRLCDATFSIGRGRAGRRRDLIEALHDEVTKTTWSYRQTCYCRAFFFNHGTFPCQSVRGYGALSQRQSNEFFETKWIKLCIPFAASTADALVRARMAFRNAMVLLS